MHMQVETIIIIILFQGFVILVLIMYDVYRYSDFYALHQELKATFQEVPFPPMPKKIFFGRSQTKNVAHLRLGDLNHFLQVGVIIISALHVLFDLCTIIKILVFVLYTIP